MIQRSYSRDLALQLNSFTTQLDDREDGLKATTDASHNGRIAPSGFIWNCGLEGRYSNVI
jgi:hypothetical protein